MRHILAIVMLAAACAPVSAQEWSRFRGPNGSGIGQATIPLKWDAGARRWDVKLPGTGHGSPVLWGEKIFLNTAAAGGTERSVVCLSADDGAVLWTKTFAAAKHKTHKFNSFASSTPAVDAHRVYTCWGTPKALALVALDHGGKVVWQRDLGPVKGGHGFGASPVLHNGMVILNNDQDGTSSLIAVDAETGADRWRVPRQSLRLTYATPCLFEGAGAPAQMVFTNWQHGVTAINPADGSVLWENRLFGKDKERAIGSPIVAGDLVIGTCGFVTKDKHMVALRPSKVEGGKAEVVWRTSQSVPHIPTPVFVEDRLYLWNDQGIVSCLDVATGKAIFRGRIEGVADKFFGSPVHADGRILCVSDGGAAVILEAGRELKVLAIHELDQTCRSTPAIAHGRIYIRTAGRLLCIGGK